MTKTLTIIAGISSVFYLIVSAYIWYLTFTKIQATDFMWFYLTVSYLAYLIITAIQLATRKKDIENEVKKYMEKKGP